MDTTMIIICACVFFLLLGIAGGVYYFYFMNKTNDGVTIVTEPDSNGQVTNNGANGRIEGTFEKQESGDAIDSPLNAETVQTMDPNKPYLLKQTSIPECKYGVSFGSEPDNESGMKKMYVRDGCSGIFSVKDNTGVVRVGSCVGGTEKTTCNLSQVTSKGDTLVGFEEVKTDNLRLIKEMSSNKCSLPGSITTESNKFYVNKGCQGYFQFGPFQGYCHSNGPDNKILCPIGESTRLENNKTVGLIPRYLTYASDVPTCEDHSPGDVAAPTWGLIDSTKMFAENGCYGDFQYGISKGECDGSAGRKECTIGNNANDNLKPIF